MRVKCLLSLFLIVSLVVSLCVFEFGFVPSVKAQEPKSNVFFDAPPPAPPDWQALWILFNQHAIWDLEWYDGISWVSIKSDLTIQRNYPREDTCKITLIFNASQTGNYRLTFGIDARVKNYVTRLDKYQYELEYDDYSIIFDWRDVIPLNLNITHGIKEVEGNEYFWFRMRRDDVPKGAHVEIDPTLTFSLWVDGFTNTESTGWTLTGTTPYLNAVDNPTNIVSTSTTGSIISRFNFTDTTPRGVITSVKVCIYAKTAGNEFLKIELYNTTGGPYTIATATLTTSYAWYNYSCITTLSTWIQINAAQLRLTATKNSVMSAVYVDAALLSVDPVFTTVSVTSVHTCPLDSHTFVIAYHDEDNDDFSFQIYDTNGTQVLAETDVYTTSGGTMQYTSIGVSAFNSTTFVIGWYDGTDGDATFAIYNKAGTLLSGPTDADTDIGISYSVQVSCFNSTHFVIAWYDNTDRDATFAVYTSSSVQVVAATDADTTVGLSYSVSVSTLNSTTFVIAWYDNDDTDVTFAVYNSAGTKLAGPTDADLDTSISVSVSALNSTHFVIGWFDYTEQDSTFAVYNSAGTLITGPIDADTAVGATPYSVQVSALNSTAFVISWYDMVDFDLSFATYLSDGTAVAAQTDVESWPTAANTPFRYQSPCSQETATDIGIYNDNWIIAYANTTTQAIWRAYKPDGTAWDGTIPSEGESYTVDLTQSVTTTLSSLAKTDFTLTITQPVTSAFTSVLNWNALLNLQNTPSVTLTQTSKTDFTLTISSSISNSFTETEKTDYKLNPSNPITATFTSTPKSDFTLQISNTNTMSFAQVSKTDFVLTFNSPTTSTFNLPTVQWNAILNIQTTPTITYSTTTKTDFTLTVQNPTSPSLTSLPQWNAKFETANPISISLTETGKADFTLTIGSASTATFDALTPKWDATLSPQFQPSITFEKISQTNFLITINNPVTTNWLLDIIHTSIATYTVNLATSITASFETAKQWFANIITTTQPTVTLTQTCQSDFTIIFTSPIATGWTLDATIPTITTGGWAWTPARITLFTQAYNVLAGIWQVTWTLEAPVSVNVTIVNLSPYTSATMFYEIINLDTNTTVVDWTLGETVLINPNSNTTLVIQANVPIKRDFTLERFRINVKLSLVREVIETSADFEVQKDMVKQFFGNVTLLSLSMVLVGIAYVSYKTEKKPWEKYPTEFKRKKYPERKGKS